MGVLFGTLGFRPYSLIPSINSTPDIEKLVLYHSPHPESRNARHVVVQYCRGVKLPVTAIELSDAFNLIQIAKKIKDDIRKIRAQGKEIVRFNIAGGTKLMSSAALLVCVLEGIAATYVHDDSGEEIDLPLLQIHYSHALTPVQRRILRFLLEHGDKDFTETALANAMNLHKATMNHHVKELLRKGIATLRPQEGDSRGKVIKAAPAAELLLD